MARLTTIKTNFTAGEISPRLLARVDITRYHNGARELYNTYPLVHGGARRRCGSKYSAGAKNNTKQTRIVPFVNRRTQAFLLELGELYMRFFTPTGQIVAGGPPAPVELVTPWDDLELADLKYVQRADTMFFAHPSYATRKLVRFSNTSWKLSEAAWDVPPSEEIGERPNTTLTLGAVSGGAVVATAAAASFEAADVGRYIESGAGRGQITVYTSSTQVTLNIAAADAFASVGPIAANAWKITESPKVQVTPSAAGPEGATITLTAASAAWKNLAANVHVGSYVEINDGLVEITGYTSTTVVSGIVKTALNGTAAAASEGWALRQVAWNAVDGYPGAVGIFQQRLVAGGTTNFPNTVWGTRTGEYFNFADGVADADGFVFALDSDQLDTIEHLPAAKRLFPLTQGAEWSMTGGVEKPLAPTNVQSNPETAYGASACRPVRVGNEVIFVEVGGKKVRGMGYLAANDAYNAPDISILSEHVTGDGIREMAYQKSPDQVVWMVRADGHMVSMSIDRDQEAIGFAHHKTKGLYESVAVIPSSDGSTDQLWAVVIRTIGGATKRYIERFEDGLQTDSCVTGAVAENAITAAVWAAGVLTLTRAGHGYATDDTIRLSGFVAANDVLEDPEEGIEADPAIDGEYTITVTGANTYTVPLADNPGAISTLGTDAKATKNWAGFDHLNGETLDIVTDGYVAAPKTVAAGAIVLNKAAYSIEGGQHFTSRITTLPPEVPTGTGTAQGNALSIHEVIVRFYKSKGGKVNGHYLPTRNLGAGAILDQPVPELTGDKHIENLGWGRAGSGDSDGSITIEQDQPLPMQVLGVIMRLTANDG